MDKSSPSTVVRASAAHVAAPIVDMARERQVVVTSHGRTRVCLVSPQVLVRRDALVIALSEWNKRKAEATADDRRRLWADVVKALHEAEADVYPLLQPWWPLNFGDG